MQAHREAHRDLIVSLFSKGKGMAEGQSKESHPLPAPGSVLSEPDILIPNPTRFSKPLHRLDCQSATHPIVYELVYISVVATVKEQSQTLSIQDAGAMNPDVSGVCRAYCWVRRRKKQ